MTKNPLPSIADYCAEHRVDYRSHAEEICEVGQLLWEREMVASNDGNISVRVSPHLILCTPTGVSKRGMKPDDLVLVDETGAVVAGHTRPSSELKMHVRVYEDSTTAGAVVHAHPTFATVFAVRGEAPPTNLVAETIVLMPTIPLAPFAVPSTQAVAESLEGIVGSATVCLLEHHGALSWAPNLMAAYLQMERLEHVSKLAFYCELLGCDRPVSPQRMREMSEVFPHIAHQ